MNDVLTGCWQPHPENCAVLTLENTSRAKHERLVRKKGSKILLCKMELTLKTTLAGRCGRKSNTCLLLQVDHGA